jgi:hypothetical protein
MYLLHQPPQLRLLRIKAVAKHIGHLASPGSADLNAIEDGDPLLLGQVLQLGDRIHSIMIRDGNQFKTPLADVG